MNSDPESTRELEEDSVELSEAATQQSGSLDSAELERQVEHLRNELANGTEQMLRIQAEAQNVRRRAQQDVERAHKYALEKFVADLLPVADNLERAVAASREQAGDFTAVAEGVELTLKALLDTLARHNVEQVDPAGEPFSPDLHQAMAAIPNPDAEPNTVLEVFQRGYTLSGRLVRPALVVVSKAPGSS